MRKAGQDMSPTRHIEFYRVVSISIPLRKSRTLVPERGPGDQTGPLGNSLDRRDQRSRARKIAEDSSPLTRRTPQTIGVQNQNSNLRSNPARDRQDAFIVLVRQRMAQDQNLDAPRMENLLRLCQLRCGPYTEPLALQYPSARAQQLFVVPEDENGRRGHESSRVA
jgi:hypothetical protein